MKISVIVIIFCFFSFTGNAQKKVAASGSRSTVILDTLNYLKTFEARKKEYIGKKFSYLLGAMEKIQPQTVWSVPGSMDSTIVTRSLFRFSNVNYPVMNETKMMITWEKEMPYKIVSFNNRRNKLFFSESERRFYGGQIVKNIMIYR